MGTKTAKQRILPGKEIEETWFEQGLMYVAGMDEAGRGPLAGPVAAACVMFSRDTRIDGVDDSKKLTRTARERLFEIIIREAVGYSIVFIDEQRIDAINILNATREAMVQALVNMKPYPQVVLIDAVTLPNLSIRQQPIIKGDEKCFSIAAASILAKVTRDRFMEKMDSIYPEYGFKSHKGYGSGAHMAAIARYGPCPLHRRTFIKSFL